MPDRTLTRCLTAIIGILFFTAATLGVSAQEASPEATPPVDLERASAYPVAIHPGTCEDIVAQPVGPAIDSGVAGRTANAQLVGITIDPPALVASDNYDGSIAYFTEAPHVIAIHASSEEFGTIIACGQIAGFLDEGTLVFPILAQSDVPVSGIAILEDNTTVVDEALDHIDQSVDFGDDSIHLTVYTIAGEATDAEEE